MHRGGDLELGATGHNVAVGEALEHQELEHAVDNTDGLREHMCLMLLFPIRAEPPRLRQNAATCREALGQPQLDPRRGWQPEEGGQNRYGERSICLDASSKHAAAFLGRYRVKRDIFSKKRDGRHVGRQGLH